MSRQPRKSGTEWSNTDINKLKNLAKKNVDTDKIAKELERSGYSGSSRASNSGRLVPVIPV